MQRLLAIAAAKGNPLARGWLVPVDTQTSTRPQISPVPQALASMGFNKASCEPSWNNHQSQSLISTYLT